MLNNNSFDNIRRIWQFSSKKMGSLANAWLVEDETATEMLERVLKERPFLLLPPLHRVPIRVGNVVELVGPSSSSKTHILMQAAITCILPKQWNGVSYGGLEQSVMFIDLDCRFDISHFSDLLNHRIMEAGSSSRNDCQKLEFEAQFARMKHYNEELFALCMKRFLYIRCYDSSEFLATLKTLHYRLRKEREAHGLNVHFLLIDSIGAFHWLDRCSSSFPLEGDNRKSWHLQNVSEAVVQEIRRLLLVHPMLVMATKAVVLGNKYSTNELTRNYGKWPAMDNPYSRNVTSSDRQIPYREYMPAVWQSFVTHRILVRATDDDLVNDEHPNNSVYLLEWLMPPVNSLDKFTVTDKVKMDSGDCSNLKTMYDTFFCGSSSVIYEDKTYLGHLSSLGSGGDHIEEKDCQNILRFFGCPYSISRYFPTLRNSSEESQIIFFNTIKIVSLGNSS